MADTYGTRTQADAYLLARGHTAWASAAAGVEPQDEDAVAIGISPDDVTESTMWLTIAKVLPLAPGSITLLYELTLAS